MDLILGNGITADSLNAHKIRLETIAQNIANASTTRGANGKPYQRQLVAFSEYLDQAGMSGVRASEVMTDSKPGKSIYDPGHPHANADGMVQMPNVEMTLEMVDMITASRAYEANLSAAKTARMMAQKALEIGR